MDFIVGSFDASDPDNSSGVGKCFFGSSLDSGFAPLPGSVAGPNAVGHIEESATVVPASSGDSNDIPSFWNVEGWSTVCVGDSELISGSTGADDNGADSDDDDDAGEGMAGMPQAEDFTCALNANPSGEHDDLYEAQSV